MAAISQGKLEGFFLNLEQTPTRTRGQSDRGHCDFKQNVFRQNSSLYNFDHFTHNNINVLFKLTAMDVNYNLDARGGTFRGNLGIN